MINLLLGVGCFDKNMYCQDWVVYNECYKNLYLVFMICFVSCGVDCSKYFNLVVIVLICDFVEKGVIKVGKYFVNNCIVCDELMKEFNFQINFSS